MLAMIRIDEHTWSGASRVRQLEWEIEIRDLVDDPDLRIDANVHLLEVGLTSSGFALRAFLPDQEPLTEVFVPHDALRAHIVEYVQIVRQMENIQQGMASARLEVLDMAKKVTHDSAGRTLRRLCKPLSIDMHSGRKLFSLLFSLKIDTSELSSVRSHRPIR